MNCQEALELMLETETSQLRLQPGGGLETHLAECALCAAKAERLAACGAELRAAYAQLSPYTPPDDVAAAVLSASASSKPRRRSRTRAVVSLAALTSLAAAALLLLLQHDRRVDDPPAVEAAATPFEVDVPPDKNAMVFHTRNPNITVVWIYSGD
jgi:hypothetical protein